MKTNSAILHEDGSYLGIHKPCGVHSDEALVTLGINGAWELAHRLDFETSGVLLFARPDKLAGLRALFKDPASNLSKIYLAGATRKLPAVEASWRGVSGTIGSRYRGSKKVRFDDQQEAEFKGWHSVRPALHRVRSASPEGAEVAKGTFTGELYEVELLTGVRHQIRSYFAAEQAPLVGDPVYGSDPQPKLRLELHAWRLSFEDPSESGRLVKIEAPLV